MKLLVIFACLIATPYAMADEQPKAACLNQDQLNRLVQSESAKAVAQFVAQEKSAAAKDAYEIVQKAFTPVPPAPPTPAAPPDATPKP